MQRQSEVPWHSLHIKWTLSMQVTIDRQVCWEHTRHRNQVWRKQGCIWSHGKLASSLSVDTNFLACSNEYWILKGYSAPKLAKRYCSMSVREVKASAYVNASLDLSAIEAYHDALWRTLSLQCNCSKTIKSVEIPSRPPWQGNLLHEMIHNHTSLQCETPAYLLICRRSHSPELKTLSPLLSELAWWQLPLCCICTMCHYFINEQMSIA